MSKKIYHIENIDCANCAAKIERKISQIPGIDEAVLTFATRQLQITADDPDRFLPEIQKAADAIEPGVIITPRSRNTRGSKTSSPQKHSNSSEHEHCGCGHEHSHHGTEHEHCGCGHEHPHHSTEHEHCGCGHEHPHHSTEHEHCGCTEKHTLSFGALSSNTRTLLEIILGTLLFIAGEVLGYRNLDQASFAVLVLAYLILGGKVLLTAIKNLGHGQIFDENFLMSIATLGAFFIQEYPEAVGVMLFYRIGVFFEHIAVEKSRSQIMDAVDLRPETVFLLNGEATSQVAAEQVKVNDILLVRPGDRIPLDGIILDGESRIDTSPITGEPVPVKAGKGDEVLSGCVNTSGLLKIRVNKVLEESMVTRILDSVENAAASKPKIDRFITRFARIYTPAVVLLALATAVIPSLFTGNWEYWIYTALSFLVMSCPCALVLSVPLAFFSGIGAGSKKGILFKGGISLEAMNSIKSVVMDKTGTITEGNFVVQRICPQRKTTQKQLLALCASCELSSTHPIGTSILSAAREQNLALTRPLSVEELAGYGIKASFPDGEVLCGNQKLMEKYKIPLENYAPDPYGTEILAAQNGVFLGSILIADTIKADAESAICALKKMNITTAILTGDEKTNAQAVASQTGIDEVHARLLPQEKLTRLQEIRNRLGAVMFVGDGINDAPVLAGADVGAAMGSGADAAIEAADVVFMTSSMEAIPQSLSIARTANRVSMQNVVFALTVKILVMLLGLIGYASMWLAVFADTGVALLCVLNSIRILYKK